MYSAWISMGLLLEFWEAKNVTFMDRKMGSSVSSNNKS